MKLKTRFSLIAVGIVIFLGITPFIVLYARGLKFDAKTGKFVQTGAIVVRTQPTKTTVSLDGKAQDGSTPLNIRFLETKDYNVVIEKDGYQPWSKRLNVRAPFVTWANSDREFITLFLTQPKLEKSTTTTLVSLSKSGKEIVYLNNNQLSLLNVNNSATATLGAIQTPPWLSGLLNIPVVWDNPGQIFQNLGQYKNLNLTPEQIPTIEQAETNGDHSVIRMNNELYTFDEMRTLIDKNVLSFTLDGSHIWYIQGNFLKRYDYSSETITVINQNIPQAARVKIIRSDAQIYALLDQNLYVLGDNLEKIYSGVTTASYDPVSRLVVFANANEILTFNPNTKNSELILRTTSPISNPTLNWFTGYVFFGSEGKVKAIELDGRDHRNTYDIADDLGNFTISDDGKNLFTFNNSEIREYTIR